MKWVFLLLCLTLCSKVWSSESLETQFQSQLLKVQTLSELEELRAEFEKLKKLTWSCEKEMNERRLPIHCHKLYKSGQKSKSFSGADRGLTEAALKKHCDAALHGPHEQNFESLNKGLAQLPAGSICHKLLSSKLNRMSYERDTVF